MAKTPSARLSSTPITTPSFLTPPCTLLLHTLSTVFLLHSSNTFSTQIYSGVWHKLGNQVPFNYFMQFSINPNSQLLLLYPVPCPLPKTTNVAHVWVKSAPLHPPAPSFQEHLFIFVIWSSPKHFISQILALGAVCCANFVVSTTNIYLCKCCTHANNLIQQAITLTHFGALARWKL